MADEYAFLIEAGMWTGITLFARLNLVLTAVFIMMLLYLQIYDPSAQEWKVSDGTTSVMINPSDIQRTNTWDTATDLRLPAWCKWYLA